MQKPKPEISFYYWKTIFTTDSVETNTLINNNVSRLYLRYFDVDFDAAKDSTSHPVAIVSIEKLYPNVEIVPVIYIKNRVFEKITPKETVQLAENITKLTNSINEKSEIKINQIQFDCDWTETTQNSYFYFLKMFKEINPLEISATIRLHQVKYSEQTGIPPVNKGVLMYYNMGKIDASNSISIYDRSIAERYIGSLRKYPLTLSVALPIFTWGIQIRNNRVEALLNKMNESHFTDKIFFEPIAKNRLKVIKSCFKGGYYFKENDEIKTETISVSSLKEMAIDLERNLKQQPKEVIFYDFDKINFDRYDKNIFEKTVSYF